MATQTESPDSESNIESYLGWLAVVLAVSLPLYRPWVTIASTAILILWLFGGGFQLGARRLRGHRLTLAILVFLGLNIVSLVWTSDPATGLKYLAKYRYLLLIPFVASSVRPIYRRWSVTIFEFAAGASVLLSIAVFTGMVRLRDAHPGNPSPTMAHLDYGLLLALAALLVLVRILYTRMSVGRRLLWIGLAGLSVTGLLINIGRAGHVVFVCGVVVILAHWARGRRAREIIGVTVAIALILVLAWSLLPGFQARVNTAYTELRDAAVEQNYDSNLGGRVAAMKVAREIFRENPWFGTGVGGNMPAFRHALDSRFHQLKSSIYWYPHFHNQYAQIATELGIAGLLALAWIFWELIRTPHRRRETDAAALVLATVYLFGFLGEPFFHKQITLVMFGLFAGLISAEQLEEDPTSVDKGGE